MTEKETELHRPLSLSVPSRFSYILLLHNCTTILELGIGYGGSSAIITIISCCCYVVDVLMLLMVPAHKETP